MDYSVIEKDMKNYVPEMTSSERMKKYISGERIDHIPYMLHLPDFAVAQILGHKIEDLQDLDVYSEIVAYIKDELGVEGLSNRLSLRTMGAAVGSKLHYPEDGIDIIVERVLEDYNDFYKIEKIDPWNNEILTPLMKRGMAIREKFPDVKVTTGVVCPLSTAVAIRPIEKILKDTRKNKEELHKLLQLCVDHNLTWVRAFTEEFGPGPTSISAPLTSTDILSKEQFKEFSYPYMEKLVDGLIEITGIKPSLHICGHTKGIWEDIKKLNVASFSVDNVEDLGELKEVLGDIMPILGNVPPVEVMRFGSVNDVIEACKSCIRKGSTSQKGYILGTGCQIPPGTSEKNLKAFVWAARTYGAGAKLGEMPEGMKED